MILKIFCVNDLKAEAFLQPMFFRTAKEAIRAFSNACCDSNTEFYKHAEDFHLYEIGSFDESTGVITSNKVPLPAIAAIEASRQHSEFYAARSLDGDTVLLGNAS